MADGWESEVGVPTRRAKNKEAAAMNSHPAPAASRRPPDGTGSRAQSAADPAYRYSLRYGQTSGPKVSI